MFFITAILHKSCKQLKIGAQKTVTSVLGIFSEQSIDNLSK